MKNGRKLLAASAVALLATQSTLAGASVADVDPLVDAFDGAGVDVRALDGSDMAATRGRLGPLALPLAIVGVDLALIGAFWGVYIPHYAGGSCFNCSASSNPH